MSCGNKWERRSSSACAVNNIQLRKNLIPEEARRAEHKNHTLKLRLWNLLPFPCVRTPRKSHYWTRGSVLHSGIISAKRWQTCLCNMELSKQFNSSTQACIASTYSYNLPSNLIKSMTSSSNTFVSVDDVRWLLIQINPNNALRLTQHTHNHSHTHARTYLISFLSRLDQHWRICSCLLPLTLMYANFIVRGNTT